MKGSGQVVLITATALLFALPCQAGPFADDLSRCLVRSSSVTDKTDFMRWMFASMSRHPEVAELATVSDAQLNAVSQRVAEVATRLLTVDCLDQAKEALQNEGPVVMQTAFEVFGATAAQGLFTHPDVAVVMQRMSTHLDEDSLSVLAPAVE